jgi:hypothetical protein
MITTLFDLINSHEFFKQNWKIAGGHEITAIPYASEILETSKSAKVHYNIKVGFYSVIPKMEELPLDTPVFA